MATIQTADLISKFKYALNNNWGYILNTWHTQWSQALQNSKVNYMKSKYGAGWKDNASAKNDDSYNAALYGAQWIGHWVTDCSGLFYWAFKELGGYMYHGSNTMWDKYCTSKGKLSGGKRTDGKELKPGTAVFVLKGTSNRSHVGLYIGNGTVIEASGTKVGVITTEITNKKWNEWGELRGVNYGASSAPAQSIGTAVSDKKEENVKGAKVTGKATVNDTKVALRSAPSTSATVLTRVDKGQQVDLVESDWVKISYKGQTGWMMKKFLNT